LDPEGIHSAGLPVDVDEDRPGADVTDCPAGRDPGVRYGDDLVSRSDTGAEERGVQRGGSGVDADGLAAVQVRRELLFESGDGGAIGKSLRVDDLTQCLEDFLAQ